MPIGVYRLDEPGVVESFRCAPGPAGWRYFAQRHGPDRRDEMFDLSVDAAWRPVRVRLAVAEHHLVLSIRNGRAAGEVDDEPVDTEWPPGTLADLGTPGGLAAIAAAAGPQAREHPVWAFDARSALMRTRLVTITGGDSQEVTTEAGVFAARRWRIGADDVWIAGEVTVAGPGFSLISYEPGATGPRPIN